MSALASGGDKAHERLQNAYIGFTANQRPSYADIEAQIRALLSKALDSNQRDKLCRGLDWHLSVVVSRARALSASGNKTRVGLGLAAAMLTNAFARRSLDWHFRRVVVSPEANSPWGGLSDMPTEQAPLTLDNLEEVLLATGSIPLLSAPVTAMAEIPAGHYFDGGISDYHFDQSVSGDGFTLFPHFLDGAYAGWFDKFFKRRKRPQNFSRTLMLVPSDSFVAALPGHKIPDRNDFARLSNDERRKRWQQAVEASTALALEWRELVEGKRTPVVKLV
ncbi:hypothetical protein GCM10007895_10720 [Paraferrimonas sedimenticola]|uniref:Uncharacterized protein n=2 Tax=Paraferrimonas sedimenticola TaxID=375674 RepID=A0AA37RUW0_9GAMM|nr:hypothetical protein GCM10007895_10720 [Paraferrimonas sedimenticola]